MVRFSKQLGINPVYATTEREVVESLRDGKTIKTSIFKHIKFREYKD
jgi:hypothetical protein